MKVYIVGKISGDSNYQNKFREAAKKRNRSMASFIRMVLNEYFEKEAKE